VAEWYAGSKLLVYIDPEDEKRFFGKEHGLLLMNHTYETDWLTAWMITNFDRNFEKDKIVIKSQLTEVFSHPDPVWLLLNAEVRTFNLFVLDRKRCLRSIEKSKVIILYCRK